MISLILSKFSSKLDNYLPLQPLFQLSLRVIFIPFPSHLFQNLILKLNFIILFLQQASDMVTRSILGAIFPEAMIHYLENYGPEKFSEIFLGEFDTPEAIWNSEMRWVVTS